MHVRYAYLSRLDSAFLAFSRDLFGPGAARRASRTAPAPTREHVSMACARMTSASAGRSGRQNVLNRRKACEPGGAMGELQLDLVPVNLQPAHIGSRQRSWTHGTARVTR